MEDKPIVDQHGRPVEMQVTPDGMRWVPVGDPLPEALRGASISIDPAGETHSLGDFPYRNPNSGDPNGQGKAAVSVAPLDNATEGRIYTMISASSAVPEEKDTVDETVAAGAVSDSLEVLKGYTEGLVDPIIESATLAAEGLEHIVTQPIETGKALIWGAGEMADMTLDGWKQIVSDPGQALDAFKWAAEQGLEKLNETLSGDPRQAGKLVGEAVGTVLSVGSGAKAAKAGKTKPSAAPSITRNSGAVILARKSKLLSKDEYAKWLEKNGYKNIEDHIKSADHNHPIEIIEFKKGDGLWMYVRDGGAPGSYATLPGVVPDHLGMEAAGRHLELIKVDHPFEAVVSTAAEFPKGVYPGVGGTGGGIQIQLPSGYRSNVTIASK